MPGNGQGKAIGAGKKDVEIVEFKKNDGPKTVVLKAKAPGKK